MIIKVEMFTVQCDNCKKTSGEDSEYSCWSDESVAWEDADNDGWIEHEFEHYCKDCYSIDDNDEITINKERTNLNKE